MDINNALTDAKVELSSSKDGLIDEPDAAEEDEDQQGRQSSKRQKVASGASAGLSNILTEGKLLAGRFEKGFKGYT